MKEIAFSVPNAEQAFEAAVRRGARPVLGLTEYSDENGVIRIASVAGCGYLVHSFVEAKQYRGATSRLVLKKVSLILGPITTRQFSVFRSLIARMLRQSTAR